MSGLRRRAAIGLGLLALLGVGLVLSPDIVLAHLRWILASPWFPLVLLGLYLVRPFLAWPITFLSALVGFQYGVVLGLPIALTGVVGTSLIPYAAGRHFDPGGRILSRFVGGSQRYFRTAGTIRGVIAARLAPTPAEPVSAAAGLGDVPVSHFVLGTLLGELPWTVAALAVGHSLQTFAVSAVRIDLRLVIAGFAGAALLLVRPAYRLLRESRMPR
ncbi:MAG: TVP38/TMEM64 family protein [Halodesulfurarchaeum sp.]